MGLSTEPFQGGTFEWKSNGYIYRRFLDGTFEWKSTEGLSIKGF